MARVKIKFPDHTPLATLSIPVRIGDINYGNHVGNDAILSIIHEARMQAFTGQGWTELDCGGHGIIMADVMIAYRGESFYGDILEIKLFADELTERTFDLLYHLTAVRNGASIEIAQAKTGMVCFDYSAKKVSLMSNNLKTWLLGV